MERTNEQSIWLMIRPNRKHVSVAGLSPFWGTGLWTICNFLIDTTQHCYIITFNVSLSQNQNCGVLAPKSTPDDLRTGGGSAREDSIGIRIDGEKAERERERERDSSGEEERREEYRSERSWRRERRERSCRSGACGGCLAVLGWRWRGRCGGLEQERSLRRRQEKAFSRFKYYLGGGGGLW